jgi:hypothetical protein
MYFNAHPLDFTAAKQISGVWYLHGIHLFLQSPGKFSKFGTFFDVQSIGIHVH